MPQRRPADRMSFSGFTWSRRERALRRGEEAVPLQPKARAALALLLERRGEVVRDETLSEALWPETVVGPNSLTQVIRRLRRALGDDARAPRFIERVPQAGYRFLPELHPCRPGSRGPIQPPDTSFVGRHEAMQQLETWLQRGLRLLTITGPGGVGKSRLLRELGRRRQAHYPGETNLCDLAEVSQLDEALERLARALGVHGLGPRPAEQLGWALAQGPRLLLLDDLDGLLPELAPLLAGWLHAAPELTILSSAQRRVGVATERVLRLDVLGPSDTRRLLEDRVRQLHPELQVAPALEHALAAVAELSEGLPLAVELFATQSAVWPLQHLARALPASALSARDHGAGRPERHRSLQVVLDTAWTQLDPAAQRGLAACGVFQGPFDADAAMAVMGEDVRGLPTLVERSLVRLDVSDGRYRVLRLISEYADQRVPEDGARQVRHALHLRRWAKRWPALYSQRLPARALEPEQDALRRACAWAADHGPEHLGELAALLWEVSEQVGGVRAAKRWLERAREVEDSAELQLAWGRALIAVGEHAQAEPVLAACRAQGGLPERRALAALHHATALRGTGQLKQAAAAIDDAARTWRDLGLPLLEATALATTLCTLWVLGRHGLCADALAKVQLTVPQMSTAAQLRANACVAELYVRQGRLSEAEPLLIADARGQLNTRQLCHRLLIGAVLRKSQGRLEEADARLREVLSLARLEDDQTSIVAVTVNLGANAEHQGALRRAAELFRRALSNPSVPRSIRGTTELNLAYTLMHLGEWGEAEVAVAQARASAAEMGSAVHSGRVWLATAYKALYEQDWSALSAATTAARVALGDAQAHLLRLDLFEAEAESRRAGAELALPLWRRALANAERGGFPYLTRDAHLGLAECYAAVGDAQEADASLSAAQALAQGPIDQLRHAVVRSRVAEHLGEAPAAEEVERLRRRAGLGVESMLLR